MSFCVELACGPMKANFLPAAVSGSAPPVFFLPSPFHR